MVHDRDYFRRRAAEARAAASSSKGDSDGVALAGQLALAYAALARRHGAPPKEDALDAVDGIAASAADAFPMMLQD